MELNALDSCDPPIAEEYNFKRLLESIEQILISYDFKLTESLETLIERFLQLAKYKKPIVIKYQIKNIIDKTNLEQNIKLIEKEATMRLFVIEYSLQYDF